MASDRDTLADLIGAQGYDLDRGPRVADWPEDERDIHRQYGWASFDDRATAMQEYRREKLAASILAAGWRPPAPEITDPTDSISHTQAAARTAAIDAIARLEYGGWSQAYDSIRDPEIDAPPPPYDEAADHPMRLTYERVAARIVDATGDALNQLVAALLPSKAQLIAERDAALARVAELEAAQREPIGFAVVRRPIGDGTAAVVWSTLDQARTAEGIASGYAIHPTVAEAISSVGRSDQPAGSDLVLVELREVGE